MFQSVCFCPFPVILKAAEEGFNQIVPVVAFLEGVEWGINFSPRYAARSCPEKQLSSQGADILHPLGTFDATKIKDPLVMVFVICSTKNIFRPFLCVRKFLSECNIYSFSSL